MRGPGGRRGMMGGKRSKNPKKTLGRLMKYIQKGYGVQFVVVLICILLSAVANVAGSMFLKSLIDDYISPLLLQASPVFTGLLHALMSMAVIYLIGIATTFVYNWLMVGISQGVLKKVRDEMFAHMQKLPIRYFDTHTHGDLMSHFTNDTDTLQQMLSQSVPQMFSSAMTIISVFIGMLVTNVWLTLFVLLGVCVMLKVVKKLGGQSAKYFLEQQKSLGRVNGYIEEMINGQKVIKVFCHEEKCKEQFDELNDELRENAASANTFANILMPIMMNIGAWKHPHEDGTITYTQVRGDVRFFDVDFGYNPDKIVLHDITLYAEPGQKVAFVGATGAGKTTITNLINRFYDLADGKIRYDGININKIKKADLRRSLGIVLQDTNLFTGTIRDNIRYGRLDATDEEVVAAAQLANADDFIRRLPDGYDTVIDGDGGSLSQGQCQLLSIARAAVADPPVMILDEATSSIDTRTESIVQAGMDGLMYGRTVFVIAHRLSTIQNADVIMVLQLGHIIERGNHEQLIAEHGKYYQLYTGAFELE